MSISIEYDNNSTGLSNTPTPSLPTFPIASQQHLGVVRIGNNVYIDRDGTISLINPVLLPRASTTTTGTIRVGQNLTISPDGVLSVDLEQLLRGSYPDFFTDSVALHERGFTLNLLAHKNQTIEPIYVTVLNLNLQNSLLFSEIRRKTTGIKLLDNFTANTTLGTNTITLNFFGSRTASRLQVLRELNLRVGDYLTVEGSGINDAVIETVSHNTITVDKNATRRVTDARLFYQPRVEASFDITPSGGEIQFLTLGIDSVSTNKINLPAPLQKDIPAGTKLAFNYTRNLESNATETTTIEVLVNKNASLGALDLEVTALSDEVNISSLNDGNYLTHLGVTKITVSTQLNIILDEDDENKIFFLDILPLEVDIPSETDLFIGLRSEQGWKYIGKVTTKTPTLKGQNTILFTTPEIVSTFNNTIPKDSVIFFGSYPYNQFYLSMGIEELARLQASEKYGYDVVMLKNESASLLGSGTLDLVENYTDITYQ
jgi:hypothetical protein